MRLLRPKVTFRNFSTLAPKSHFLAKKSLLSEKVTFELPGLEKGPNSHWFLKGWEPSARTATFDDGKTTFAEDFTKITKIFLKFLRNHFSEMQKRVPTFARLRMIVSTRVRTGVTLQLFAKMRKSRNFHFFDFWRQIHLNAIIFRFSGPKSDFSRPGSRMCL